MHSEHIFDSTQAPVYQHRDMKNQIKSNQKVLFKVGTFCNNQHKLSRAFQTDMHNKLHKLNTAQ